MPKKSQKKVESTIPSEKKDWPSPGAIIYKCCQCNNSVSIEIPCSVDFLNWYVGESELVGRVAQVLTEWRSKIEIPKGWIIPYGVFPMKVHHLCEYYLSHTLPTVRVAKEHDAVSLALLTSIVIPKGKGFHEQG